MDVLDIIFLHDGQPLWIIEYLVDIRQLILVCKKWKQRLLRCDAYCDRIIKRSWWFQKGTAFEYSVGYVSSMARKLNASTYSRINEIYHPLMKLMTKKLYLVSTEHTNPKTKNKYLVGYVYSAERPHITKYWSGFSLGQSQLLTLRATVDTLRTEHHFIEVASDRKYCRTFKRTEEGHIAFVVKNMFEGDILKYWFHNAYPTVNINVLLNKIVQ